MSKTQEAKIAQGYRNTPNCCGSCKHYSSQMIEKHYDGFNGRQEWLEEKNKRCGLGGFAVNKTAVCDKWEAK